MNTNISFPVREHIAEMMNKAVCFVAIMSIKLAMSLSDIEKYDEQETNKNEN